MTRNGITVTYNGESYNHLDIRAELRHYRFTPSSDTETLLFVYNEWGIKCLSRLEGMFAFGLYDEDRDLFYLVRDRIGIKPAYYGIQDGVLYFASEIKAILEAGFRRELNEEAVYHYFTFMASLS